MADRPHIPDPEDVGAWIFAEARSRHSRVISIMCRDRAAARIWQAVLHETRVPVPGIIVRLVAPIHERLTFRQHMEMSADDMGYEVITIEVAYG